MVAAGIADGPVIGINLGNAYASIAVVHKVCLIRKNNRRQPSYDMCWNQEGHAECIANEDGERQIALAVSYNGEQVVRMLEMSSRFIAHPCELHAVHWQCRETAIG